MDVYPIPMVPGPVKVPEEILRVYQTNYGAPGLEASFWDLYHETESRLQQILETRNRVVIQTGEGMLALWTALRSCLKPGDRVLSVATGVFGYGIADMARSIGAEVMTVGLEYHETLNDLRPVEKAVEEFNPRMITAVHCETPSGTLNPLDGLGKLKEAMGVPLLYADVVSSAGGTPVRVDACHVDLALGGSQKCLSAPPCMAFLSISDRAWEEIERVDYNGYDALKPFRRIEETRRFPYTPYWHGVAALNAGAALLLAPGLDESFNRHESIARHCRKAIVDMGLDLFPSPQAVPSPTVTAVRVPETLPWEELDRRLRQKGLVVGGSHGKLAGKVFRLGHMGSQADTALLEKALTVLADVVGGTGRQR
ncbi:MULTISPECIES: pyridoxal-phosphate-dependent aminotransferase family protein [Desulfococcus]|uniref:Aminotransferase class V n=1 Tax=Desulfococcus multivorans DSM 2059 TaxID=1121405 RepID=S7TBP9_DESML|nr:aminotransferase class V-fold PLP-dependent enzyme [Desulfococcus multivorans]AOY58913.1 aminotransferase, class V [Desulfococcus multivorans]AQV02988.1 aminotransferase [Desulfococcus multivorans]EPR34051.1 aminotransferase class V [Desulfococcus multivorans DSM 2059]MDX9818433.1 aminotransferase class V-fold PLP-dependent enzyme [Desulfococcus multivorans]SJZ53097.1 aspartate aminotransferase [Desulfococcus multivorans DSM 2059]